jgi:SAM-dependent methyltransferase
MKPDINSVQQYWDERPCNVMHSQKPQGSREYFDEVEIKKFRAEPHILQFCEFSRWRGLKILEIGCGIGTMAINFARQGAEYTGVDLSGVSVDLCRQRFDVYGLPGTVLQADAEHLLDSIPPQHFDLVFSWGVIHHSPNPAAIIRNIDHYTSTGSTVKIMVYGRNSWKNFMIQAGIDQPEAQAGCPIAETFSADELIELLGDQYHPIDVHQDHIFPYDIESYKSGEFVKQPWFAAMPTKVFQVLEKNLGWHLLLTAERK